MSNWFYYSQRLHMPVASGSHCKPSLVPEHRNSLLSRLRDQIQGKAGVVTLLILSVAASCWAQGKPFFLHDGDRVVFLGDSITEQHLYSNFVENAIILRYPEMNLEFHNAGVGGDTVSGGGTGPMDTRLDRDVLRFKPTVVTIMLGMNDGGYESFNISRFEIYQKGVLHILDRLQSSLPGVRLVLIKPSPYDEVTGQERAAGGYNGVLKRYGAFLDTLGGRPGVSIVDLNEPVNLDLASAHRINPELSKAFWPDQIHPTAGGHWIMAAHILKAWNLSHSNTTVTLNASKMLVELSSNTLIDGFKKTSTGYVWNQLDSHLPLPLYSGDRLIRLAEDSSSTLASLNRTTLVVDGLAEAKYRLLIDQEEVGRYSSSELAKGVDLARAMTPMMWQAMDAAAKLDRKNEIEWCEFRVLSSPVAADPGIENSFSLLDKATRYYMATAKKLAHSLPHSYQLQKE